MEWALGSLAGFALATVLVVVLARSNTARWERARHPDRPAVEARVPVTGRARAAARRVVSRFPHLSARGVLHRPHLPARVAAHLPHPHVPHLHLPHSRLHLPHPRLRVPHPRLLHLSRRRPQRDPGRVSGPGSGTD